MRCGRPDPATDGVSADSLPASRAAPLCVVGPGLRGGLTQAAGMASLVLAQPAESVLLAQGSVTLAEGCPFL